MIRRRQPRAVRLRGRRSFTLTELMIAVVVLVVVIVATSRIFATASKVTGLGQAAADVLQETAAIERRIRDDVAGLSSEGFLAIRCVAIRNDVNAPGPLLNPAAPPGVWMRADQLLFFSSGAELIDAMGTPGGSNEREYHGSVRRIYYGHGVQLPEGSATTVVPPAFTTLDPVFDLLDPLVPWHPGPYGTVTTVFTYGLGNAYPTALAGSIDATQPPARRWLLARHSVILADDGDDFMQPGDPNGERFMGRHSSPAQVAAGGPVGIGHRVIFGGRVNIASTGINAVRSSVLDANGDLMIDPWPTQRATISSAVFYPRTERQAPSMDRLDQSLTGHVLGSACSSFIVDWTYENGVGFTANPLDPANPYLGVGMHLDERQQWFGLDRAGDATVSRGVKYLDEYVQSLPISLQPETVFAANIERYDPPDTVTGAAIQGTDPGGAIVVYEALFGYNRSKTLVEDPLDPQVGQPRADLGYTPWPSAIRITMVLHDAQSKMESGREVQFVFDLPRHN